MGIGIVSQKGFFDNNLVTTWNCPSTWTSTPGTGQVGLVVTQDVTAPSTVKMGVSGDPIIGVIKSIEQRVQEGLYLAAISFKGGFEVPIDPVEVAAASANVPGIGDYVVCSNATASGGFIRKSASNAVTPWRVSEITNSGTTAVIYRY